MFFNKKQNALFILHLFLFFLPISCGDILPKDPDTRSDSGSCGHHVISDYNDVVRACNYDGTYECSRLKNIFLDKYPSVNCQAKEDTGLGGRELTLTRNKIASMKARHI